MSTASCFKSQPRVVETEKNPEVGEMGRRDVQYEDDEDKAPIRG
jgi:hypothetical protein